MDYKTIFDLSKVGYGEWSFPAMGLIGVAVALLQIQFPSLVQLNASESFKRRIPKILLGFPLFWVALTFAGTFIPYYLAIKALNEHKAQIVEGPITDFQAMPPNGKGQERFCVKNACFEYSDYTPLPGFHQTTFLGGPIRAGLNARVTYVGNTIARLELAK